VASTAVSALLLKILLIPMVGLWAFHLSQRRFKDAAVRKRVATLGLTVLVIGAWVAAWAFVRYSIGDPWLLAVAAAAVAVAAWQRKLLLPYRTRCVQCGAKLGVSRILSWDSNKCETCDPPKKEGEISV
jgi:hypothetical protein